MQRLNSNRFSLLGSRGLSDGRGSGRGGDGSGNGNRSGGSNGGLGVHDLLGGLLLSAAAAADDDDEDDDDDDNDSDDDPDPDGKGVALVGDVLRNDGDASDQGEHLAGAGLDVVDGSSRLVVDEVDNEAADLVLLGVGDLDSEVHEGLAVPGLGGDDGDVAAGDALLSEVVAEDLTEGLVGEGLVDVVLGDALEEDGVGGEHEVLAGLLLGVVEEAVHGAGVAPGGGTDAGVAAEAGLDTGEAVEAVDVADSVALGGGPALDFFAHDGADDDVEVEAGGVSGVGDADDVDLVNDGGGHAGDGAVAGVQGETVGELGQDGDSAETASRDGGDDGLDHVVLEAAEGLRGVGDGGGLEDAGVALDGPGGGVAGVAVASALALVVDGIGAGEGDGLAVHGLGPVALGGAGGDSDLDGEAEAGGAAGVADSDSVGDGVSGGGGGTGDDTGGGVQGETGGEGGGDGDGVEVASGDGGGGADGGVVLVEGVGVLGVADGSGLQEAAVAHGAPDGGVAGVAVAGALALVVDGIGTGSGGHGTGLGLDPVAVGGAVGEANGDGEGEGGGAGGVGDADDVAGGALGGGGAGDLTVEVVEEEAAGERGLDGEGGELEAGDGGHQGGDGSVLVGDEGGDLVGEGGGLEGTAGDHFAPVDVGLTEAGSVLLAGVVHLVIAGLVAGLVDLGLLPDAVLGAGGGGGDGGGLDEAGDGVLREDGRVGLVEGGTEGGDGAVELGDDGAGEAVVGSDSDVGGGGGDAVLRGLDEGEGAGGDGGQGVEVGLEGALAGGDHLVLGDVGEGDGEVDVGLAGGGDEGETAAGVDGGPLGEDAGVAAGTGLDTEGAGGAFDGGGGAGVGGGEAVLGGAVGDVAGEETEVGDLGLFVVLLGSGDLKSVLVVGGGVAGEGPLMRLLSLGPEVVVVLDSQEDIPGETVVGALEGEGGRILVLVIVGGPDLDLVDELSAVEVVLEDGVGGEAVLEPLGVNVVIEGESGALEGHVVVVGVGDGEAGKTVDAVALNELDLDIEAEGGGVQGASVDLEGKGVDAVLQHEGRNGGLSVHVGGEVALAQSIGGDVARGKVEAVELDAVDVGDDALLEVHADIGNGVLGAVIDVEGGTEVAGAGGEGVGSVLAASGPGSVVETLSSPILGVGVAVLDGGALGKDGREVDMVGVGIDVLPRSVDADDIAVLLIEGDVGVSSPAIGISLVVVIVEVELEGAVVDADTEVEQGVIAGGRAGEELDTVLGDSEGLLVSPASGLTDNADEVLVGAAGDDIHGKAGNVGGADRVGGLDGVGEGAVVGEVSLNLAEILVEGGGGGKGGGDGDLLVGAGDGDLDGVDVGESVEADGSGLERDRGSRGLEGEGDRLDGWVLAAASGGDRVVEDVDEVVAVEGVAAAGGGSALDLVDEVAGGAEAVSVDAGAALLLIEDVLALEDDDLGVAADEFGVVEVVLVAAADLDGHLGGGAAGLVAAAEGVGDGLKGNLLRGALEPAAVGLDVEAARRLGGAAPGIDTAVIQGTELEEGADGGLVDGGERIGVAIVAEVGDGGEGIGDDGDLGGVGAVGDGVGSEGEGLVDGTGDGTSHGVEGETLRKGGGDGVAADELDVGDDGVVGDGGSADEDVVVSAGVGEGSLRDVEEVVVGNDRVLVVERTFPRDDETIAVDIIEEEDLDGVVADLGDVEGGVDHVANTTATHVLEEDLVADGETETIVGLTAKAPDADLVEVEVALPGVVGSLRHIVGHAGGDDTAAVEIGVVEVVVDSHDTEVNDVVGELLVFADGVGLLDLMELGEDATGAGGEDTDAEGGLGDTEVAGDGDGVLGVGGDGGGASHNTLVIDVETGGEGRGDGDGGEAGGVEGGVDGHDVAVDEAGDGVVVDEGGSLATEEAVLGRKKNEVGALDVLLEGDVEAGAEVDLEVAHEDGVLTGGEVDGSLNITVSALGEGGDGVLEVVDVDTATIIDGETNGVLAVLGNDQVAVVVGAPEISEATIEAGEHVAAVGGGVALIVGDLVDVEPGLAVVAVEEGEAGDVAALHGGEEDARDAAGGELGLVLYLEGEGGGNGAEDVGGGDDVGGEGGSGGGGTGDDTGVGVHADALREVGSDAVEGEGAVGAGLVGEHQETGVQDGRNETVADVGWLADN